MVKDSLYLLLGKEHFLKKEFIQDLRSKKNPNPTSDPMEFRQLNAEETPLALLEDFFADTMLFSSSKMAVLWQIETLEPEDRERLLQLCRTLSKGFLVLCTDESNTKKSTWLGPLSGLARTLSFHTPFERDLSAFVQARAKKRGCHIDTNAVFFILEETGRNLESMDAAIEMLAVYSHPRTEITLEDAQALLGRSVSADVFSLVEMLLARNIKLAMTCLKDLLRDGGRGHEIMGVLVSQFERLKKVEKLLENGMSEEEIGSLLKIHPYYLSKTVAQARLVAGDRMEMVFEELSSCDEALKTGQLSEALALEKLALALCLNG